VNLVEVVEVSFVLGAKKERNRHFNIAGQRRTLPLRFDLPLVRPLIAFPSSVMYRMGKRPRQAER
jgi:hypothetical protein